MEQKEKNIYRKSREAAGLTREAAAEQLQFISEDRLERIENEKSALHPDEIHAMAECYNNPSLFNYYCANECPIGRERVPEIKLKNLSQITLEMLVMINTLSKEKDRLVEITVDGEISQDELPDFSEIKRNLDKMSQAIDALNLWLEHMQAKPTEA